MANIEPETGAGALDETLLELIYEAPLEEEPWRAFLQQLRASWRVKAVGLQLQLPSARDPGFDISDAEWDVRALRWHYQGRYYALNPFRHERMRTGETYRWSDFVEGETFRASEFYRNFCRPLDFEYATCLCVAGAGGGNTWLYLVRSEQQGDFSEGELAALRRLSPHLQRGLRLVARLQRMESEKTAYAATVDTLAIGTLVLDQHGGVLSANQRAEAILGAGAGIGLRQGRLRLEAREADRELQQLIDALLRQPDPSRAEALALPRAGRTALGLLLRTLPAAAVRDNEPVPALVVYLTDPASHRLAPQELIARLFGLTAAEARLAALLADGMSLAEAAAALAISEGSARTYSKRIFAKIGVSRQAELVRLVLKSVAALALPRSGEE